jgi:CheY-like chemotaxis protein
MAKILIIDDNPMIQKLLEKYISGQDRYETITAGDGRSGVEKALRADGGLPDLIITDVLMPDLNGFEVAKMLKANEKTKDIPIIFVTANNDEKSKRRAIEVGAVGYVAKPFRKEDILNVIEEHLPIFP